MKTSFIESTLSVMGQKKNSMGALALLVESQAHKSVLNRIAMTYASLQSERAAASRAGASVRFKPEQLFSFIQQVLNQSCWAARRLQRSLDNAASTEKASSINFSHRVESGVEDENMSIDVAQDIEGTITEDFFLLGNVYSWLSSQMSYLVDLEELAMFRDQGPDADGTWVTTDSAMTWADAQRCMDEAMTKLKEDEAAKAFGAASTVNFGA